MGYCGRICWFRGADLLIYAADRLSVVCVVRITCDTKNGTDAFGTRQVAAASVASFLRENDI